jgi:hypothetical protein
MLGLEEIFNDFMLEGEFTEAGTKRFRLNARNLARTSGAGHDSPRDGGVDRREGVADATRLLDAHPEAGNGDL